MSAPRAQAARYAQHGPATLPLDLLLEACGLSLRRFGKAVRASHYTIQRGLTDGLPAEQADRYACAVGLHPIEVWGCTAWADATLEGPEC